MVGAYSAIRRAYARLKRITPIPADCGRLCGRRCCKGGAGDGMILFPGEEGLLPASFAVTDRDINGYPVRFAVCMGRCKRDRRPLACRIYPYAPYLDAEDALTVIADPRARYICPLLADSAQYLTDRRFEGADHRLARAEQRSARAEQRFVRAERRFVSAVEGAFRSLLEADEVRPMLKAYSGMLDEYKRFTG